MANPEDSIHSYKIVRKSIITSVGGNRTPPLGEMPTGRPKPVTYSWWSGDEFARVLSYPKLVMEPSNEFRRHSMTNRGVNDSQSNK
jgi:hypothetical protein